MEGDKTSDSGDHDFMDGKRVLGIDGCKKGWIGIALGEGRLSVYFAAQIGDLVSLAERGRS
ncbi:hypothetical protein [Streptosporangium sp. LJ11]|uniref:hypothetical protein n=1 Tax=Streptosporangium sp. LJ11 TaxID=3436927 RepID=UPI003F7A1ADD